MTHTSAARAKTLRLVFGDQLSHTLSSLQDATHDDIILMVEIMGEATYAPHHKQKLVLVFSAMRHFAKELKDKGFCVDYVRLDDAQNTGDFTGEVVRALGRHNIARIILTEPSEYRVRLVVEGWMHHFPVPVTMREDDRFLCTHARFEAFAKTRKTLRMEFFYRQMRRLTGYLMAGEDPIGGVWNFDSENRKALPEGAAVPKRLRFPADAMTRAVMALVREKFAHHFGDLDSFAWPVTRQEALLALTHFITEILPNFGTYQDAMKSNAPFLFHSLISTSLNLGLLDAREVCQAAEQAYHDGHAPLNAVEGFIRQIIGWREYIRGIYWHFMPDYAHTNELCATRPLPNFYWTGETKLNCLRQTIKDTHTNAYAHHIQRLMVTGNFALLCDIAPRAIEEWYLAVYADAYDWVELPNVHGMVMFADGGVLASKPYAASGAYINRMSDYCKACPFDVKQRTGEKACPFNYLYWNFLLAHADKLLKNPRMAMAYRTLAKFSDKERMAIKLSAHAFLHGKEMGGG